MFARTERLMLRPGWPEDAPELVRAIGHEDVVTRLARAPWPYALGDAQAFLAQPRGGHEPRFLIFDDIAAGPRLVGGIELIDGEELAYWLTPAAWGRGYATEAGRAMIDIARHALGVRRLHARHFVDNPASGRVLAKLGFCATGEVAPLTSRGRREPGLAIAYERDLDEERAAPVALAA